MSATKVIVLPTCAICRDDDDDEVSYVVTKCGHLFHTDCMKEWNRNEQNRGGRPRCPYCNTHLQAYDSYGSSSTNLTRLHQLVQHRVMILEDGKPTPEEELKGVRDNLNSIKVILNKETDKLRSTQADKVKLEEENKSLKATIAKLTHEVKLNQEKVDSRTLDLRNEKLGRQKDLAAYSAEKQKLLKQIIDAKQHYEKLKMERIELQKEMSRKKGENAKLQGIMANQTNLVSTLQAQTMQLNRERDDLVSNVNALRQSNQALLSQAQAAHLSPHRHLNPIQAIQSNQLYYRGHMTEPAQPNQLVDILQGLSGGFLKLEKEYMGIKKLLEEKNERDGSRPDLQGSGEESLEIQVRVEAIEDRSLVAIPATPSAPEPHLDPITSNDPITSDDPITSEASKMQGLVHKMEVLEMPSTPATATMIDPRLFE